MKKPINCYIYTCVSTYIQVDGYSLDAQKDKLHKCADYENMIVAGEYSEEGFSGKNIQGRYEFQQILKLEKMMFSLSLYFNCHDLGIMLRMF